LAKIRRIAFDHDPIELDHDLMSLFEHDLFSKAGYHFSGSCSSRQHLCHADIPDIRSASGFFMPPHDLLTKRGSLGFELLAMSDDPSRPTAATPSVRKPLTPAAERALAEAEARRQAAAANAKSAPKEYQGPKGPEPTRYGDWENKGIASDF
jgi:hypothetical protein